MINRLRVATLIVFTAASTALVSAPAHAQKAALTQNIDEKGRVPYQAVSNQKCSAFEGVTSFCSLEFTAVPVGYRLVITYVSASYDGSGATSTLSTAAKLTGGALLPGGTGNLNQGPSFVPVPAGGSNLIVNNPLVYYVEAGGVPKLTLQNAGSDASAFLSGYLVAIN